MEVKIMLKDGAFMPTHAYEWDAGWDLKTPYSFSVYPGGREDVDTGVCVEIPHGFFGLVVSKSGLMVNDGIITVGIIDCEYRGSIHGVVFNHSKHNEKDRIYRRTDASDDVGFRTCEFSGRERRV